MTAPARGLPIGKTGNFKIVLLGFASLSVLALLLYSQRLTDQLLAREREVVALYARSIEYVTKNDPAAGDLGFAFEVIRTIDFPIVVASATDSAMYWRNFEVDTASMSPEQRKEFFKNLFAEMDAQNKPIRAAVNDTLVLNNLHYGESELIRQLRWLPVSELAIATIFILIAYVGFSYIKRSEQSNIWVGMAKETAHQLGTPLSSLMGWMERLRVDTAGTPRLTETVGEMEHDVHRLNKVAARFSKIGSTPSLQEEDLTEVIEGVIQYIAKRIPKSGKKVDLVIETPGTFRARINRELFEWVIENLMKNALDAMEGNAGKISFAISRVGDKTMIDVSDTGKGIDPKFHKEVFRPGYSTKIRGWGLGLTLAKRIIEEYHKGRLFVKQSTPGVGTTFRIRLQ
ncbi:MAG: HAMP domain-containing histidine kinase [Bacteroidetes bacterium]|nr:HAMP domain-containing histidine kinase [Bacteroidota bacterium]